MTPHAWVLQGDCRDVLAEFPENSIDAIVTDPPYELAFMGKKWDASGVAFSTELWREVLRVLKPGGHMLAFSGTRTYHRMVCAIEDAGFEIRDQLAWMYGTGFPKSLDISKAIDKGEGIWRGRAGGVSSENGSMGGPNYERTDKGEPITPDAIAWNGWGTALKPAQEPIVLARKPLVGTVAANVLAHGTGGINIDACRIGTEGGVRKVPGTIDPSGGQLGVGFGCNGKIEPLDAGRWPANVILDEAAAAMLDEQSGERAVNRPATYKNKTSDGLFGVGGHEEGYVRGGYGDTGGASRFFYVAKASTAEREAGLDHLPARTAGELTDRTDGSDGLKSPRAGAGRSSSGRRNHHPTVKPIALMRYLVRMITPPGGIVLDPFAGSGTTLVAAVLEGHRVVGIELTPEYVPIIEGRIAHALKEAA